ncbi:unnamed protein product [Rotaria sp. Silwood1]|nr:unnamed protein product [Rotaria sp. Silwood1]CAF3612218.1 unnamed protein product [Rotaria sp. Silwood1]CAF3634116.1 unnamed protein product [Rotaria sp. Silwood1]CAF4744532.1 unnamed protein product [Rotaria sp. Silwood1]
MLVWRRFIHSSVPRYLSQSAVASNSPSPLSVLRKKTGYSLSHCRTALQQFNDNLEQAEAWLHQRAQAEGWSRATKLQSRAASQGLIGIITNANAAAMVEINCETDFVAKNEKFQQLVSHVANSLIANQKDKSKEKVFYDKDALSTLPSLDDRSKTLADITALCVGSVGENVVLRRGIVFNINNNQLLASYCHGQINNASTDSCRMGKYGALVNYSQIDSTITNDSNDENASTLSSALLTRSYPLRTICQNNIQNPIELSTYLDQEDETSQLHEYLNGYIYALPSRESTHDLFVKHLSAQIEQQQIKNIHILPMDIRIQTPDPIYIYYPSLCLSTQAPKTDQAITREPVVIIELITPTTERFILHEKSINYKRIPSLKEIIYIWPNLKLAQVDFRDGESSKWTRKYYGLQDKIPLVQAIGNGELVLTDIFNNMVSQILSFVFQYMNHFDKTK